MAEQRYQAVLAVTAQGETVKDVAARWGVSRQTVHAWLAKYEVGGLEGSPRLYGCSAGCAGSRWRTRSCAVRGHWRLACSGRERRLLPSPYNCAHPRYGVQVLSVRARLVPGSSRQPLC